MRFIETIKNIWKIEDLRGRLITTFLFVLIYRFGSFVILPGIDPGALTACRRAVVMPRIDEWVNQQFLGRPANIGEDRALTNLILKSGYAVVFQRSAIVLTRVPETGVLK